MQTWEDEHRRLTRSVVAETHGFSYLEPKRQIENITALSGPEAATLGPVLSHVSRVLRDVTGSDLVYVYIFGAGVRHLHIHLAPHVSGDALNEAMIKGTLTEHQHPSGVVIQSSEDFPPLSEAELRRTADRVREALSVDVETDAAATGDPGAP